MIEINLLSPDDRLNSKWEKINRMIISSATVIIITQLVFALLIFSSIKYLEIESGSLDKQLESLRLGTEAKEIAVMQSDIRNYGGHLKCVSQIQDGHIHWTKIIDSLNQIVPDETRIKRISVEEYKDDLKKENKESGSNKYKIIIKGESEEREYLKHLLEFENSLKESEMFELIIEEYLEKNYISSADFEFRALINKDDVIAAK